MNSNNKRSGKKRQIDWHTGFEGGLKYVLRTYRKAIRIHREYYLSRQPLKIDYLVVKKKKGTIIDNDIGILFKRHNIIEYKNPKDELNIDTLWKVIGYIGIYKSLGKRVNAIPETEIAAFIFRSVKPSKLLEQLVDLGHQVIMMADGIYSIQGLVSVPLVIIVMNFILMIIKSI